MAKGTNYVLGVYDDEDVLVAAVSSIRKQGIKIHEVYSPFPVHGLDEALGYKRSRLPRAAFMFGFLGTLVALTMQYTMLGFDWPMIIGGKNYTNLPPFMPVTFELTVLLSALGMVATFLIVSNLKPYAKPRVFDVRATDDKHIMAIDLDMNENSKDVISKALSATGASEVNDKTFD